MQQSRTQDMPLSNLITAESAVSPYSVLVLALVLVLPACP